MDALFCFLGTALLFALLGAAASTWGAETRDGFEAPA
jgi:hypothetical protein